MEIATGIAPASSRTRRPARKARFQDGLPVNLQGSDFNATIRISWDDPVPPQIGSAGAEAEDAYGMRDIKYVS